MAIAIKFLTEFDGKALAKGEKGLKSFATLAKKVAGTLGVALSARAVVNYSKNAVKAFAADEKAAKSLGQTLKNTGNLVAGKGANSFIDQLQRATGVADDQLRPALQSLLNSTGDYATSTKALNLALDISAGTTKDVGTVSNALAKAYAGNTTALAKLGTGLSKATLKTGDMAAITETLQRLFTGQAGIAAETYAGKMERLQIATSEASETIGGALAQSFVILAGTSEIADATKQIDDLAEGIANLTVGLADWFAVNNKAFAKSIADTFGGTGGDLSGFGDSFLGKLAKRGQGLRAAVPLGTAPTYNQIQAQKNLDKIEKDRAAREKKAAADAKKSAAAKIAADKKAAADKKTLAKGNALFDLEQIGIAAALKMSIDKDTRLRLELLQAIQLGDADLVLAKMKELAEWQKNSDMAKLSGVKTISEAQLSAINTSLLTELAGIDKLKIKDAEKDILRNEAWKRYNDAIKYAGGLADLSTYSQKLQDQELLIQRLASIRSISEAQTAADNIKQAALEKYLATLARVTIPGGNNGNNGNKGNNGNNGNNGDDSSVTDSQKDEELAKQKAEALAEQKAKLQKDFDAWVAAQKLLSDKAAADLFGKTKNDSQMWAKELADKAALAAAAASAVALSDKIAQDSFTQGIGNGLSVSGALSGARYAAQGANRMGGGSINVTVNAGVVGSEETITQAVQDALNEIARRGYLTTYAGAIAG